MLKRTDRVNGGELNQQELEASLAELCASKAEEFRLLGYESVTPRDIWDCISDRYRGAPPPLYQLVNDILSLKPNQWMNWMTMGALRGTISWDK